MKRTQIKDALRNIWKQKISFLSIVVIAALGVTMFLGIDYAATAIRKTGSAFYNGAQYRDIELVSTLLLSEQDIEAIRETEGVTDAEGILVTNAKVRANDLKEDIQVLSLTERINLPVLYEGRLPERNGECAVEQQLLQKMGWQIGDRILLCNAKDEPAAYLMQAAFTVCGTVMHPDHVCGNVPETPYVLVTRDAFDEEQLNGCFMKAEIVTVYNENAARYEPAYRSSVGTVSTRIEALAETRTVLRDAEAKNTLAENRAKLDDAEQQLRDGRAELDRGQAELRDGEQAFADGEAKLRDARAELDDAKAQLLDGEQKLKDSRAELDDAKAQLEAGKAELDAAKAKLDDGRRQLVSGWNQIEDAKDTIRGKIREKIEQAFGGDTSALIRWASRQGANPDSGSITASDFRITDHITFNFGVSLQDKINGFLQSADIPERILRTVFENLGGEGEYSEEVARSLLAGELASVAGEYQEQYDQMAGACSQWDAGHATYLYGKAQYDAGLQKYNDALTLYENGEAQYAEGLHRYEDALVKYNDGEAQYAQGVLDLEEARKQLEEGREKLSDGEAQYADALAQYEDGRTKLQDAEKQLETLGPCKWILMDVYGNASFVQLGTSSNNLKSMEMTFSLLFVLVGALVIYATISKMVDEQRALVGTTKALGFFSREIFSKYLLFGVSATVLGAALGLLIARFWIQSFVLNGYNVYFNIDLNQPLMIALPTVLVFLAGIALAVAAIWFACRKLLRQPAIQLMAQAVPKIARKPAAEAKESLPLYSRLIVRNIKTDWKRVLVTIVSIAGCCSLVVIGVTLRQAVSGATRLQYGKIIRFDSMVRADPDTDSHAMDNIADVLEENGVDGCPLLYSYVTVRINDFDVLELYSGDLAAIEDMIALDDAVTGEPIAPTDDGILISKRFSENYKVKQGDSFEIALNGTESATVHIAGIFNSYMGRGMYMSDACYQRVFGKEAVHNAYLVRLNGVSADMLTEALRSVNGYESYNPADTYKKLFDTATSVLDAVVLLFILMAAVMAGVVLMNLTNIYIMQKKRELTVMRINGFTVKEVIGYVLRETAVDTVLGIVLGIGVGTLIGYRIVRSLEQSFLQLDRTVQPLAWLIGAVMTVVFTVIINVIVLRKVKNLKLTDVA